MVVCAPQLLRYLEINLVNKIVKHNMPAIVSMMVEKTNEFIDLKFVQKANILVVISKSNSIFFIKDMKLLFSITGFDILKHLEAQRANFIDKYSANLDQKSEDNKEQDNSEYHSGKKLKLGDTLSQEDVNACGFRCGVLTSPLMDHLKNQKKFRKLAVSQNNVYVASKGGYLSIFMLDPSLKIEPSHIMTGKLAEHIVNVKQLIINSHETMLLCVGKYPFQVKEKQMNAVTTKNKAKKTYKKSASMLTPTAADLEYQATEDFVIDRKMYDFEFKYDAFSISLLGVMDSSDMPIDRIFPRGVHDGAVMQLAGCKSRSTIASIADGKNIRIWAHTNDWSNEENFYLDDQPLCIDWHPLCIQLAIGFSTSLRLYIARESKLILAYNRGTNTTAIVKYNEAGNLLAASDDFYILIFDTIRYEVIRELAGHAAHLLSIKWSLRSDYLFTLCKASSLIVWSVSEILQADTNEILPFNRFNQKDSTILALEYDHTMGLIIVLMKTNITTVVIKDMAIVDKLPLNSNNQAENAVPITFLLSISINSLFVAFQGGYIRVYYWPYCPGKEEYYEAYIDQGSNIVDMKLTQCDRYLIIGMDNGNIFCLETAKINEGNSSTLVKTAFRMGKI